jgi:DNA-binding NarL/FixJ family response regulator
VEVRSPRELLLPSVGALAEISTREPADRRWRPLPSLANAFELETAIGEALTERARRHGPGLRGEGQVLLERKFEHSRHILTLSADPSILASVETASALRGTIATQCSNAQQALDAFRTASAEAAVIDLRDPDEGFELAVRLRELPGLEQLPIILLDQRDSEAHRATAREIGAAAYYSPPISWGEIAEALLDQLDRAAVRRFRRFPTRLAVHTASERGEWDELTERISLRGMCLRAQRDIACGSVERYWISLPGSRESVGVDGEVVSRRNLPGYASVLAGIRFLGFEAGSEPRWIDLVEKLARLPG